MSRFIFWRRRRHRRTSAARPVQHRFQWLGGRRYLADAPYALPSDPQEVQRQDFQHFIIRHALRSNYLAPIGQPKGILDVGCGTGRWAMEMAAQFPQANVVGIDLVPPESAASLGHGLERQPKNVAFVEGDIVNGLPFAHGSFDFVYMRLLFMAIPARQWPYVLDELIRVTKPGGWIESVETWMAVSDAYPAWRTITGWLTELIRQRGMDPMIARKIPEMMRAKGLVNVTTREVGHLLLQPGQRWKQVLLTLGLNILEMFRAPIIAQGIATPEQYDLMAVHAKEEMQRKGSLVWPLFVTYGQAPTASMKL